MIKGTHKFFFNILHFLLNRFERKLEKKIKFIFFQGTRRQPELSRAADQIQQDAGGDGKPTATGRNPAGHWGRQDEWRGHF